MMEKKTTKANGQKPAVKKQTTKAKVRQFSPETLKKMSLACKRRWKNGDFDHLRKSA